MRLNLENPLVEQTTSGYRYVPTDTYSLVVGASNDRNTWSLIRNVRGLLKSELAPIRQARLRTVHMNLGDQTFNPIGNYDEPYTVEEVAGKFPEDFCRLVQSVPSDLVAVGKPTRVSPMTSKSYWWLRKLILDLDVPVMVVPDTFKIPSCELDDLRVLLADDLSHGGMTAIRALADLGTISKPMRIYHVHVQPPGHPSTAYGIDYELKSNYGDRYDEMDWGLSRESIHAQLYIRSALLRNSLGPNQISYEAHVLLGNVAEELVRFSHSQRTDLLACGKPHLLKQPPKQSGNITPKFLVTHNAVTMIAPDYTMKCMQAEEDAALEEGHRVML